MNLRQHKRRAYAGMQSRFIYTCRSWFGGFPAPGWRVHLRFTRYGDGFSMRRRPPEEVVALWIAQNGPLPPWITRSPRESLLKAIGLQQDLGAHDPVLSAGRRLIDGRLTL